MKKIFFTTMVFIIGIVLVSFSTGKDESYTPTTSFKNIEIPAEVQTVIDNKCYGCHNTESKGEKGKKKLNWDFFTNGDYNSVKIYTKLGKIEKILNESKMPPAKFLERYPNKKLTDEESQLLLSWVKSQKETLLEE